MKKERIVHGTAGGQPLGCRLPVQLQLVEGGKNREHPLRRLQLLQTEALRVRGLQQLDRALSEELDLRYGGGAHGRVDGVQVHRPLVREVEEDVVGGGRLHPTLLVAEDEVHPVVQVHADVLALQRLAVDADELVGAAVSPWRELDVIDLHAVLAAAEGEAVLVAEELGQVKELRDELLDVGGTSEHTLPGLSDGAEQAVGVVEVAVLQGDCGRGGRAPPGGGSTARSRCWRTGSRSGRAGGWGPASLSSPLYRSRYTRRRSSLRGADGFAEVAEGGGVAGLVSEVEGVAGVVGEDPGKHGVLREVVERAPGDGVELHEIVEVAQLPPLPG